jgi:hypothetical protein
MVPALNHLSQKDFLMLVRSSLFAVVIGTAVLAGCADSPSLLGNSTNLTTQSTAPTVAAAKFDPACPNIAAQIETLRKAGIAEKIEKASLKKYKMTTEELVKADQLNKANADFQGKCSTYKSASISTAPAVPAPSAAVVAAAKPVVKAAVANPAAAKDAATAAAAAVAKP